MKAVEVEITRMAVDAEICMESEPTSSGEG